MKQFADRAFLALLLAVLLAVPLGVALWSHKETTAYYENRSLAEAPGADGGIRVGRQLRHGGRELVFRPCPRPDHAAGAGYLGADEADGAVRWSMELSRSGMSCCRSWSLTSTPRRRTGYGAAPIAEDFGALSAYVESLGGTFCYGGLS